jgi:DNA-binding NarL/FixJ family response regulator
MRTKRVFFIEDNEITSIALRAIIDQAVHLEYVGQATEVKGVLDRIRASTPHVVLMKWPLENGLELIKQLQELIPSPAVALFAPNDDTPGIAEAVICGAHGVLIKGMQAKALETALWSVGAGGIWIERATFNRMFTQPNVPQPSKVVALELKEAERLSPREKEIAALIAEGLGNGEIAERLGIGKETVKTHISKLMRKTGMTKRTQIAIAAHRSSAG